jgi:glycogen debranching enzyme
VDGGASGLYDYDTRILSRYRLTVGGAAPALVAAAQPEADQWVARFRADLADGKGRPEGPRLPEDALELALERMVGRGLRDRWTITNHSALDWAGAAFMAVDADFADIAEVGRQRRQQGRLDARVRGSAVELRYVARRDRRSLERAVRVRGVVEAGTGHVGLEATEHGLGLRLAIPARGSISFTVQVASLVDGRWRTPGEPAARTAWRARRLRVEGAERLRLPFERAIEDLRSLRNDDLEGDLLDGRAGGAGWVLNAGVPAFTGFFGRDALTSGIQAAMAGTEALRGAVEVAAATQADADDPWRDEEPGKMLHELRRGPLSMLGLSPRDAYYGSQTTPAIFVVALSELWHWTGDDGLLREFRDAAMRAIDWAEAACEVGGPAAGFLAYQKRSTAGLRNQGWKDSDEAIRHADGRIAEPPIATVEEQAFLFLALQRAAEVLVALGENERADALLARAAKLRSAWHEAFWMPREGFYALALDRDGGQVASVTSNPGHALATGIVPPAFARQVADRLLSPALFSGWGVRTLAEDHPSYNPLAYHLGTVWPVENATFALGFRRYGLDEHLDRLASAFIEAAAVAPHGRLPEAITGHRREPGVPPFPYPGASAPQAWSSSAVIQMAQVLLGLYPFAPLRVLAVVRPRLPAWLPEVTLRNLRVGKASADLRFERRADGSASVRVLRQDGTLHLVSVAPPVVAGGKPPTWLESIEQAALTRAPGRLVRAARIALGLE